MKPLDIFLVLVVFFLLLPFSGCRSKRATSADIPVFFEGNGNRVENGAVSLTEHPYFVPERSDFMKQRKKELQSLMGDTATVEFTAYGDTLKMTMLSSVLFLDNSSTLKRGTESVLQKIRSFLQNNKLNMNVFVYTDSLGVAEYNLLLTEKRAKSLSLSFFPAQDSMKSRNVFVGKGAENPVGDNSTEKGRLRNRRVLFLIAR